MNHYHDKTQLQLIEEIESLKKRIEEFEQAEIKFKQSEKELRESEEKLSKAQEVAKIGSWEMDITTEEAVWSDETYRLFGLEPQEFKMTFERLKDFLYPEDRKTVLSEVGEAIANKDSYEGIYRIVRRDNEVRFMHSIAEIEHDESGKPVLIRGTIQDITERKKAEEKIRQQQEELQIILDSVPALVFYKDKEDRFIRVNKALTQAFNMSKEEIIGKAAAELSPIKDYWEDDKRVIETGIPLRNIIEPMETPEGTVWVQTDKIPYKDYNGNIVGIIGFAVDITEHKQVEDALRESEEKYRLLFESIPDVITTIDEQGTIISANNSVKRILGYEPSELLGKPVEILAPEELRSEQKENIIKAINKGFLESQETIRVAKDGTRIPIDISVFTSKDSTGNLLGVSAIMRDITERKQVEEVLRENEEKLRNIVEYSTNLFYSHTPDHILTYISPQTREFFDCEPEEALIRWTEFVTDNPINDKGLKFTEEAIKTGERQPVYEFELVGKKGRKIWVEVSEAPIVENGKTVAIVGALTEITERKRAEEALKQSEARLRQVIDLVPHYIFAKDHKGRFILANSASAESMGTTPEEIIGKTELEVAPVKKEAQVFTKDDDEVISSDKPKFIPEGRFTDVEGKLHFLQTIKIPFTASGSQNPSVLGVSVDITERKQVEKTMQESEERYRTLTEAAQDAIFIIDRQDNIAFVNSFGAGLFGQAPIDVIGKSRSSMFPPELSEQQNQSLQQVFKSGESLQSDNNTVFGKHVVWLSTRLVPLKSDTGEVHAVLGISRDITERKLAEARVAGLANVLETSLNEIYICDAETLHFIQANKGARNNLGYSMNELNKLTLLNIKPELNKKSFDKLMKPLRSGKKNIVNFRTVHKRKDGSVYPVDIHLQLTKLENRPVFVAIILDISERKKAEEEIRKLSHSVEQSPAIVMITDISGNIEYVNPKFEEVTGYTAKEVFGKNPSILKSGETNPGEYEILWKTIEAGGEWHGEFHNRKKNGELYWESASISAIKDTKGQLTHYIAIKEDITGRKAMDKRLRESHNRLRSFAERLQMIREEERATIAREIHDDLGQSLTALKMDISWVKNNPEMGVEAKTAKFDMMLDIINSTIQTVKRIATELRPGILDDLGLVPAIEWQAAEFQNRFKIQCNVSINRSDVIIKDEISIAVFRIFQETLTNVARHSGATKVDIKLNFHVDNKLIMEIADNGVGIDEEQINSSKSLGLFGMRERVNILNGEMEITSEHGKGTKVRVLIPVSKEVVGNKK